MNFFFLEKQEFLVTEVQLDSQPFFLVSVVNLHGSVSSLFEYFFVFAIIYLPKNEMTNEKVISLSLISFIKLR